MKRLQAHRGVSSEYPENTIAAFKASVDEGYDIIELDPKYTKDGKFVFLHDKTLNRTARRRDDGSKPAEDTKISDITLAEAQKYEYGSWKDEKFRGEPIPTLADVMSFGKKYPIPLKIDNVWQKFPEELQDKFFDEIAESSEGVRIGFTCKDLAGLEKAAKRFPGCDLHYDGGDLSAETLGSVLMIAKGHPLVIWICYDNEMTKWFKGQKATKELCEFVHGYGEIGVWILSKREELERAVLEFDADVIETTGHIKPEWLRELEAR